MNLQERKDTADIVSKQSEIINKKVFVYLAISGGSWVYGVKEPTMIGIFAFMLFMIV